MLVMILSRAPEKKKKNKSKSGIQETILHIINFLVSRALFFHMHRHYFDLEDLKIKTLNRHCALAFVTQACAK
jgi:hypothetical protein